MDSFLATENPQALQAHKEIKASKSTRCKMSTLKKTNFNNKLLNTLNAAYPPLKLLIILVESWYQWRGWQLERNLGLLTGELQYIIKSANESLLLGGVRQPSPGNMIILLCCIEFKESSTRCLRKCQFKPENCFTYHHKSWILHINN